MSEELKIGDEVVYLPFYQIKKTKVKATESIGCHPYYWLENGEQGMKYRVMKPSDPELIRELKEMISHLQETVKKLEKGEL